MRYDTSEPITADTETVPAHGVYTILRDIDSKVQNVGNELYMFRRETSHDMSEVKNRLSTLESTDVKRDKSIDRLQSEVAVLKEDVHELRQDIKELTGGIRELSGGLSGMQTRLNWWLVFAGIVIALLQYIKG